MRNFEVTAWPSFDSDEIDAVSDVLKSGRVNYWTGEKCTQFEREFANWCGVDFAIATMNGTVALELGLRGLGVGRGDEVIVTPRSFIASASCVVNVGAIPIFADVDEASGNLTAHTIRAVMTPRTKAVICVHLAGVPCDLDPIIELVNRRGIFLIEDCAQAHGAMYKGKSVGSIGHVGAWSFCQDKIITTGGEGGMVTCRDRDLWERMWSYKDHGKNHDAVTRDNHSPGFRWLHSNIGSNFRMTEMQAAIGLVQLKKIDKWRGLRTRNASAILMTLQKYSGPNGPISIPRPSCGSCAHNCSRDRQSVIADGGKGEKGPQKCLNAYYKLYAYVKIDNLKPGWSRDKVISEINGYGIPCFQGTCGEIYQEQAFRKLGLEPPEELPVAKRLARTSLMFLVHPTLSAVDIERTCEAIDLVLSNCKRLD